METLPEDSTAKSLFFRAISNGSTEDVRTLVRLGANINWREDGEDGLTGLQRAVGVRSMVKLKFLLSKGADVNQVDKEGVTPLMTACFAGEPAMVVRLCQVPGILLNSQDNQGLTALMFAVNSVQCIEKLRAITGVDWNAVDKEGYSAIMVAVYLGNVGVVEALLPVSTLDLNIKISGGVSVAHIAVVSNEVNAQRILELLCKDGRVDWNIPDPEGNRPVLLALEDNKVEMFRTLVRTPGVDTNITNSEGRSLVQLVM